MTVLSDHNGEGRNIKAETGHESDQSIKLYNARMSFILAILSVARAIFLTMNPVHFPDI